MIASPPAVIGLTQGVRERPGGEKRASEFGLCVSVQLFLRPDYKFRNGASLVLSLKGYNSPLSDVTTVDHTFIRKPYSPWKKRGQKKH